MLNTDKLIYILPDVAYLAELLPGKKPHSYAVSSFRQINGKFLDDNELISASVIKLLAKFEKDTYQLILPDFLFTNTIVNVKESSETKVKEYIKEKLLPQLNLSSKTHQIQHYVLTEHRGVYKVQLSAIENNVLSSIKSAAKEYDLTIKKIYPLSWTTKSLISLEPSISVIQMGSRIYLAQHYIGIDQTNDASVDSVENLLETIKTLKGAEPSIQTVYLASNSLVEKKFKEGLSDTLPLQQLVILKDEELKMPPYVKLLIEAGMKTLSIPDFNLPEFSFVKVAADPQAKSLAKDTAKQKEHMPTDKKNDLPKPTHLETVKKTKPEVVESAKAEVAEELVKTNESIKEPAVESVETKVETKAEVKKEIPAKLVVAKAESVEKLVPKVEDKEPTTPKLNIQEQEKDVDLAQFAEQSSDNSNSKIKTSQKLNLDKKEKPMSETKDKVIKNKDGVGGMLKTIFIFLASVSITVAIGIGLGLGFIKFTNKNEDAVKVADTPAAVEVSPAPEVTPTPTAEPEPEINKSEYKILVVNATTIAGHAGKTKTNLENAEFENIKAANAKGEYEAGVYVLLEEEDAAIVKLLSEVTDLELKFAEGKDTEDASESYNAVIVLAE